MTLKPSLRDPKIFPAGTRIIEQGEAGECAYIVETGRVEIQIEQADGRCVPIGSRGPGSMIGEMAIIDNAPRMASVIALEDCTLLEITREDFLRRLDKADPVLRLATHVILTRYRDLLARADILKTEPDWMIAEKRERAYAETSEALETVRLSNDFKTAMAENQLSLNYQPIVDLTDGRLVGFESLMRWTHPERGFISPAVFIPVIEDSGQIVEASKWALAEALAALGRISALTGDHDLFMSVNFSSRDFSASDFVPSLNDIITRSAIDPTRLHLEITERLLMGQPAQARDTLNECRAAGMGISIDDFGTGYSSLSYLHYFPIDTLKIDRSFVKDMTQDPNALELVKSIIALGKNLKMKIIAEGVETQEESEILRRHGCDQAQGYFFSRPLAEGALPEYFAKNKS